MTLSPETADAMAAALYEARRTRVPVPPLTEAEPGMTMEDGYLVQQGIVRRYLADGDHIVGYKLGLTSKPMQEMLGVDSPDFAPVMASHVIGDGVGARDRRAWWQRCDARFGDPVGVRRRRIGRGHPPGRARARALGNGRRDGRRRRQRAGLCRVELRRRRRGGTHPFLRGRRALRARRDHSTAARRRLRGQHGPGPRPRRAVPLIVRTARRTTPRSVRRRGTTSAHARSDPTAARSADPRCRRWRPRRRAPRRRSSPPCPRWRRWTAE